MSPVSWSEPCLLVWEQGGFPRGGNVAIEHSGQLYIIDGVPLAAEERWLPGTEVDASATYPSSSGQIPWLSVKRRGHLSEQLRAISAITLDKR